MEISILFVSVLLAVLRVSSAAVAMGLGPCPEQKKPGEKWYPSDCQECTCHGGSWTCESCGTGQLHYDPGNCYVENTHGKKFPDCCLPDVRCRGKPGFDKSRLLYDVNKDNEATLNDAPASPSKIKLKKPSRKGKKNKKENKIKLNKLKKKLKGKQGQKTKTSQFY
ncbi:U-scoloptoxin(16)-Cw1a [Biomphalaria glabrata]|nr:U-scoloptoxin(16)-Cw1a [Biomphalaria glabrata]